MFIYSYLTWIKIEESCWKIISPNIPKSDTSNNKAFVLYGDILIYLCGSELYSELYSLKNIFTCPMIQDLPQIKRCSEKQPENFMQDFFKDKTFADVIFQVEDKEFPAHKSFLSFRSPYFKKAFTSKLQFFGSINKFCRQYDGISE